LKNRLAPINQIPPEVLALIPDSWDLHRGPQIDQGLVGLTHVCRTWREIFISRSSLWTNFDCRDTEKTHVYLERAKSSPIYLWLEREGDLSLRDPFLQIIPQAIGQLKYLSIKGTSENLQDITAHLSLPAPLLERLYINGGFEPEPGPYPTLTAAIFNGDLSSLRQLRLQQVCTELPWRNMINLTSFVLGYIPPDSTSTTQLLDFFESAPHLRKVQLIDATPFSNGQNGRLVAPAYLEKMDFHGGGPSSLLLDHLLIPVHAKLGIHRDCIGPTLDDHLPRSLDNLRNLSNFTDVYVGELYPCVRIRGPNGQFYMTTSNRNSTRVVVEFLARFDVSKTERLEIANNNHLSSGPPYQALLAMERLRTLVLSHCYDTKAYVRALEPNPSLSDSVVCPKLEELVFAPPDDRKGFDIESVIEMAKARASRGVKLRIIRIVGGQDELEPEAVSELGKHVLRVEYGPEVDVVSDEGDESDEED